jgi:hypothetical protein
VNQEIPTCLGSLGKPQGSCLLLSWQARACDAYFCHHYMLPDGLRRAAQSARRCGWNESGRWTVNIEIQFSSVLLLFDLICSMNLGDGCGTLRKGPSQIELPPVATAFCPELASVSKRTMYERISRDEGLLCPCILISATHFGILLSSDPS